MVMKYWRPESPLDVATIQRQLYSREAGGIFTKDMVRYFESHAYRVFIFRGEWGDLEHHVSNGRPLIVTLKQDGRGMPLHYVVVAGIDPVQSLVLVNDPAQRKLLSMSRTEFEQQWRTVDNWTLLALPELDLASEAFRENHLSESQEHLRAALRADGADAYTNNFLAGIYYLQDNTEAALKYWNRAGKPEIQNIRIDPPLQTDPVLLDRAFAFSRGSILRLADFEETQARLTALRIFPHYRLELSPAGGERFDVTLRATERTGLNLPSWIRGLPFQTIRPEVWNIAGKAVNITSIFRWDADKRRAGIRLDAPLVGDPRLGIRLVLDRRDENWSSPSGGFHLKRREADLEIQGLSGGRWSWTSGATVSTRRLSDDATGGTQLKYSGTITRTVVRDPTRDFRIDSSLKIETGKLFGSPPMRFSKISGTASLRWRFLDAALQLGKAVGQTPFDERFVLGIDRDSNLWLRAHSATIHGRKNALNTSRSFVIANTDFQKTLSNTGWFHISAGPFVDTGRWSRGSGWLVDAGIEMRLTVLGSFGLAVSYGRSLSDPHHNLFLRERSP
jgi:hypothetical protein